MALLRLLTDPEFTPALPAARSSPALHQCALAASWPASPAGELLHRRRPHLLPFPCSAGEFVHRRRPSPPPVSTDTSTACPSRAAARLSSLPRTPAPSAADLRRSVRSGRASAAGAEAEGGLDQADSCLRLPRAARASTRSRPQWMGALLRPVRPPLTWRQAQRRRLAARGGTATPARGFFPLIPNLVQLAPHDSTSTCCSGAGIDEDGLRSCGVTRLHCKAFRLGGLHGK
ncbi:hypothetical protein EJB05_07829, partial [Eragrostis curvula]